ncbi:MAG: hypothetical protein BMS9Abin28_1415 [Anaerolineae bacterium]|nr:MAG: hypothetical protein BMS9Abin28_1415 [Anaerolineae bacterium]
MDIEFLDPAEAPLPPDQVSFRAVEVEPYSDAQRLLVRLSVTPFQVRPTIDLEVHDEQGVRVAASSIVETTDAAMSLTLHLLHPSPGLQYTLVARLLYEEQGEVDRGEASFVLPEPNQER